MRRGLTGIITAVFGSGFTIGFLMLTGVISHGNEIRIEHAVKTAGAPAVFTTNASGDVVSLDFTMAANDVMPAVVHIRSTEAVSEKESKPLEIPEQFRDLFPEDMLGTPDKKDKGPRVRRASGSGVIITGNGYIVTNNHVIEGADELEVTLHDNRSYQAEIVGTDPSTDIAVIKIKEEGLKYLAFANSEEVKVGEWVLAVGNPFNLNSTVTAGIVSAKGRNIHILDDQAAIESFIQTDAAVNPGNSGGALVDLSGNLIGINTAIASPTGAYSGYSFAVPSNLVSKVVEDLLKHGIVQRGFLGVMIQDVNSTLVKEHDLNVARGVYVDKLSDGGAAKEAGIKSGDVIVAIDGKAINKAGELQSAVGMKRPGDQINVTVNRKGSIRDMTVTLRNADGSTDVVKKEAMTLEKQLGAEFETLSSSEARKLDISGGVKVKTLSNGKLSKETSMNEGFIITHINGKPVKNAEALKEMLSTHQGGVMIQGIYPGVPGKKYYAFGM